MHKRLFFSDIDGTLIRSDGTISDALAAALCDMARAGHSLILTSGRPLSSILSVKDYLENKIGTSFPDSYIIANNGTLIYDCKTERPVYEKTLPFELVDLLQTIADQFHIHIQTYAGDAIVCKSRNEEINFYRRKVPLPLLTGERFTDILPCEPYKMLTIGLEGTCQLMPLKHYIEENLADRVQAIFSGPYYMELIRSDAGKGQALHFLCDYLSVPYEHSYAAGDSENDISMLQAAGMGYAMAGGDEKVKSSADKITALDCEHDGLLEIIDTILKA